MSRFITDEHIPSSVVEWLRAVGHDVVRSIDVVGSGAADLAIMEYAGRNSYIILTLDRDFLYLYPRAQTPFSAIVVRTHPPTPVKIRECLDRLFSALKIGSRRDVIIVVTKDAIRIHGRL